MSLSNNFAVSNMLVINKYVWMGRQLRNFNNIVSIMNWENAMILVKSLLLEIQPEPQSSTNTQPQSPSITHAQHRFKGNYQHIYLTRIPPSIQASRSITPPTAVCFKPATEKPFTRSPPRCSSYKPVKPPPLSTYTLCLLNIKPVDLPQNRKKRKLAIPPSVDYHASIEKPQPTSTETTATYPPDFHLWSKIKCKGAIGCLLKHLPNGIPHSGLRTWQRENVAT